jgi:hypothetical protein
MISVTFRNNKTNSFPKLLESYTGSVVLFLEEGRGIVLRSPVGYGRKRGDIGKGFDTSRFVRLPKEVTVKDVTIINKLIRVDQ